MANLNETSTREFIIKRILDLQPNSQRQWGSMTVEEMLTHCSDQIRICIGQKNAKDKSNFITTTLAKWIGLYLPISMPKNLKTFKEIDPQKGIITNSEGFEKDRITFVDLIQKMVLISENHTIKHPIFGQLTKTELGKLTYVHLDHHLKQFGV